QRKQPNQLPKSRNWRSRNQRRLRRLRKKTKKRELQSRRKLRRPQLQRLRKARRRRLQRLTQQRSLPKNQPNKKRNSQLRARELRRIFRCEPLTSRTQRSS